MVGVVHRGPVFGMVAVAHGQVIGKGFGHKIGLGIDLHSGAKRGAEGLFKQRIMGTAKDSGLGLRHPAFQRIDMAADEGLGQDLVALLDRVDKAAAGLCLDIDADGAEGQFALEAFLVRTSGLPKDKLVVKAAVSTEGLPADLSPIGRDPEIRIFVHLE